MSAIHHGSTMEKYFMDLNSTVKNLEDVLGQMVGEGYAKRILQDALKEKRQELTEARQRQYVQAPKDGFEIANKRVWSALWRVYLEAKEASQSTPQLTMRVNEVEEELQLTGTPMPCIAPAPRWRQQNEGSAEA